MSLAENGTNTTMLVTPTGFYKERTNERDH